MHRVLAVIFCHLLLLLILGGKTAVNAVNMYDIQNDIDKFNITCSQDKCERFGLDSLGNYPCHCGPQCVQLRTCCANTMYARVPPPKLKPACRRVLGHYSPFFIMDQCPSGSAWSSLCHEEWNEDNDIQKLVPVTSIWSSLTYKNYFCFRCHETSDEFVYWNLVIKSDVLQSEHSVQLDKRLSLIYYRDMETWMAIFDEDIGYFPVNITVLAPQDTDILVRECEHDIISECSDEWSDEEVRSKCHSYMSLKEVRRNQGRVLYKNIHCALCNFERLKDISCRTVIPSGMGGSTFSFSHLMDINTADGELVGKEQKCPNGETWDPFSEKCRKVTCAMPGFKVKNNECVAE